jgi:hypothetical protein
MHIQKPWQYLPWLLFSSSIRLLMQSLSSTVYRGIKIVASFKEEALQNQTLWAAAKFIRFC